MQSKSLLIAIAAFAVTTTGVHAYSGAKILNRAGLSEQQKSAIETARELREVGDLAAARDVLVDAGIDEQVLGSIRAARSVALSEMRLALEAEDYDAFRDAVVESPLADLITSPEDFEQFREAHALRAEGEWSEAAELFGELGIEHRGRHAHHTHHRNQSHILDALSAEQREALMVAKRANDRETVLAILDEAGVALPSRSPHWESLQ